MSRILTGWEELDKALAELGTKSANRIATSTLRAAMNPVKKEIRKAAPLGATGALRASINARFEKKRKRGTVSAKVGVNVGKSDKKSTKTAPHSHLVALGTKSRTRRTIGGRFAYLKNPTEQQLSSGVMPSNDFVRRGYQAARAAMNSAMLKAATKAVAREAARVAKGKKQ